MLISDISKADVSCGRLPVWLRRRMRDSEQVLELKKVLRENNINTVCKSAGCPNLTECFQKPTATFMILGNICTRNCRFCGVLKGLPEPVDHDEPRRIGEAVKFLGLRHAVVTSVTRDDLDYGGAEQFAETVKQIRRLVPYSLVEVLIPDFKGNRESIGIVLESNPDVLNHNVETVPRLYTEIRQAANFKRSLIVLERAKAFFSNITTKSGLMLGLGETHQEVLSVFRNLIDVGCDTLTIGQYLSPTRKSYPVKEYITPEVFTEYREEALNMGFKWVMSGPFVRSSYNAEEMIKKL